MAISIRSSDPASASRAFPWPVLEAGNGSYPTGVYTVDLVQKRPGRSFSLTHSVENAALVQRWIQSGYVRYVCAVSAPVSAYRDLHVSKEPTHVVAWNPDDLGSYPLFTPMLVCGQDVDHKVDATRDCVHPFWDGTELHLTKGSRLAVCATFALQSGVLGLLDFRVNEDLASGQFKVEPSREGGFRFKVELSEDIFRHLNAKYNRREPSGWNVMTHIVSAAFALLQRRYRDEEGDEGWSSFSNLLALSHVLEQHGLPHWSDENFQPERAATCLYPHRITEGV